MSSSDQGYVHDPGAFDDDGERTDASEGREGPVHPASVDREFGWRGWVLVAVLVFAFVVAPLAILLWPPSVNYRFALLILPLAPAVALGITAVWATTRP